MDKLFRTNLAINWFLKLEFDFKLCYLTPVNRVTNPLPL